MQKRLSDLISTSQTKHFSLCNVLEMHLCASNRAIIGFKTIERYPTKFFMFVFWRSLRFHELKILLEVLKLVYQI